VKSFRTILIIAAALAASHSSAHAQSGLQRAKCSMSLNGCYQQAHDACNGRHYQILQSESHPGGLLADVLPGPVTWYTITYSCRPAESGTNTAGFKEHLEPYFNGLQHCWLQHFDRALQKRVTPQDFSRIIDGACGQEVLTYSSAIESWWAAKFPYNAPYGSVQAAQTIANARKWIIASYTERWYAFGPDEKKGGSSESTKAWTGSGFFITAAGHILTNAHVAKGCVDALVRTRDGVSADAKLIALDEKDDLAILKTALPVRGFAAMRTDEEEKEGDQVTVFGFPLAGVLSSGGNATFGYISATKGVADNPDHLQVSAAVQPGNSGGPLLDASGNVIGVVVSKLGLKAAALFGDVPQNVNFAIKSSVAARFLAREDIPFNHGGAGKEIPKAEIVERAKEFSVRISCTAASPEAASPPPEAVVDQLKKRSADFLVNHYLAFSSENSTAMKEARSSYGQSVDYFGKTLAFDEVISDLSRFFNRWPLRSYSVKPHSATISCDESSRTCKVQGVMIFDARSTARRQRSVGEANFDFTLKYFSITASPSITQEAGSLISRRIEPFEALGN
jgi:S1-C subfamily serine protease